MDPLSIASAVGGFISLIQPLVPVVLDIWHEPEEHEAFVQRFQRIESDLTSLKDRLEYMGAHFKARPPSVNPFAAPQQNDIHSIQTRMLRETKRDLNMVKEKIESVCTETRHAGDLKRDRFKRRLDRSAYRLVWTMKKKKIQDLQKEILALIGHARDKLSDHDAQLNYESYSNIQDLKRHDDERRIYEILEWVCPYSLEAAPVPVSPAILADNHFVNSDKTYQQWYEDGTWQLNCYGTAGSGKSVRSQAVYADLRRKLRPTGLPVIPVLAVFFHHKNQTHQSPQIVLRGLLRQLIANRHPVVQIPQQIDDLWAMQRLSGKDGLSEDKARRILNEELDLYPAVYLVVDAIDEAEGRTSFVDTLIKTLRHKNICIFSTDRRDPRKNYDQALCYNCGNLISLYWICRLCQGNFERRLELCQDCYINKGIRCKDPGHKMNPPQRLNIKMETSSQELEQYVSRFLDEDQGDTGDDDEDIYAGRGSLLLALKQKLDPKLWDSLPLKVSEAADGNFLYAKMFMERLRIQPTLSDALDLVKQLNHGIFGDLEEQYDKMLNLCFTKRGSRDAYNHIALVASAYEVLPFAQLTQAAAIARGDRLLEDFAGRCCDKDFIRRESNGLLAIENTGRVASFPVTFFHRSFSVYLEQNQAKWIPDANQRMLEACLAYLKLDPFSRPFDSLPQLEDVLEKYPFASYAACYWGLHAKAASASIQNNLLILELLNDRDRLSCVMQLAWHTPSQAESTWNVSGRIAPLHVCAFYGLESLCRALLQYVSTVDPGDEILDQTPLIIACRKGHIDIVELLLKAGANPNHLDVLDNSPLMEAIENGDMGIFSTLLKRIDLDLDLRGSGHGAQTALIKAAKLNRLPQVKRLLESGRIDVNKSDTSNCTALIRAIRSLNRDVVALLLNQRDTDLNVRDSLAGRTALDWAADPNMDYENHPADIENIASVLIRDPRQPKPSISSIINTIQDSKPQLLTIFLKAGIDSSYVDEHGRNLLHLAATAGDFSVVNLVFEELVGLSTFDIDTVDRYGATALYTACANLSGDGDDHIEAIEFLLKNKANVSLRDLQGITSARRAQLASPDLWGLRVAAMFEPYLTDAEFKTLNEHSSSIANVQTCIRLADLDALNTVLSASDGPLGPEIDPYTNSTILHQTVVMLDDDHSTEFLRLLLPRSKHLINATDLTGRTCAHIAVLQDSFPNLELLVDGDADLKIEDKYGDTIFKLAQRHERYKMCLFLVQRSSPLPHSKDIRRNMLHAAVEFGEYGAVTVLVEAGVDIFYRDAISRETALQRATALWEAAAEDVNKDIILNKKMEYWEEEKFKKAKFGAPEVKKRERIMNYLREAQKHAIKPLDQRRSQPEDLSQLIQKLESMDPKKTLDVDDLVMKEKRSDSLDSLSSNETAVETRSEDGLEKGHEYRYEERRTRSTDMATLEPTSNEKSIKIEIKLGNYIGLELAILVAFLAIIWLLLKMRT
ncbi:MAG: hypothetical protein M1821_002014 [Bathelium mastoideum]|nr:MAG: hypothetical protein M1821_002014 [Bathelium mastoideum]